MVGLAMNDLADSASEQWQELWSLMAQLQAAEPTELVKFHGGNQREDGIFVMPWTSYDPTVNRIVELLNNLEVIQKFHNSIHCCVIRGPRRLKKAIFALIAT